MTVDTTVTNGRFIGPDTVNDSSITIHDGRVQAAVEMDDVWRTVNASGFLVWPGPVQFGRPDPEIALELARNGITTIISHEADSQKFQHSLDYISLDGDRAARSQSSIGQNAVVRLPASSLDSWDSTPGRLAMAVVSTPEDLDRISAQFEAPIEVSIKALTTHESLWSLVADESRHVHVSNHEALTFPLLPYLYHEGHVKQGIPLQRLAAVTSAIPASIYGVAPGKGWLDFGSDGDLVVFDPDSPDPYREHEWPGRVILSLQRGNILFHTGQLHALPGSGIDLLAR